jgi:alkanesulfonate monooxygenase SsuD/methylene tetrahydromethanopterin reductase-like flavin-dependent oxidoreductase (luciferase family)
MKFWANTSFSPPEHNVPLARAAEEAGLHGILMSDHIFYPRVLKTPYPYSPYEDGRPIWEPEVAWPDVWVTIGAMQAVTTTLQFGTGVYIAPARDLFTVAKQVGTAAVLSGPWRGRRLDERGVRSDGPDLRQSGWPAQRDDSGAP